MSETMIGFAGAALAAAVILICLVYWRRRMQTRRLVLVKRLLASYFNGDIPAGELGKQSRHIASRHFLLSSEFYSLAIAAFQSAFDTKFPKHARLDEDESKLMRQLAALKREFGLTDRYRLEGRPGRE